MPLVKQLFDPNPVLRRYGPVRTMASDLRHEMGGARIRDLVSFYPEKLTITMDGEKLEDVPGQTVISHGPDRNLSVDEIGGIQLIEEAVPAQT
jgi:hypothetical protein